MRSKLQAFWIALCWFGVFALITQVHDFAVNGEHHLWPIRSFLSYLNDKHYLMVIGGTVLADLLLSSYATKKFYGDRGLDAIELYSALMWVVITTVLVSLTYLVKKDANFAASLTTLALCALVITKSIDYRKPKNVKISRF